jgi:hypothetical protein
MLTRNLLMQEKLFVIDDRNYLPELMEPFDEADFIVSKGPGTLMLNISTPKELKKVG